MSVFKTQRPTITTEQYANQLGRTSATRRKNLKQLRAGHKSPIQVMEAAEAENELEQLDNEINEKIAEEQALERLMGKRSKTISGTRLASLEHKLISEGNDIIFKRVIFEMVYNALWIDQDVKENTIPDIYDSYTEALSLIESVCDKAPETKFIAGVKKAVYEVCQKATARILENCKNKCASTEEEEISFELNKEEEDELDYKLSELQKDEIEELVKKKVLTVIQDEQKSGKDKAEMFKELEDETSEEDELDDDMSDEDVEGTEETEEDDTVSESFLIATEGIISSIKSKIEEMMKERAEKKRDKTRKHLLDIVSKCENMKDIEILRKDKDVAMAMAAKWKLQMPDRVKTIEENEKWLNTVYNDAIEAKAKELSKKPVSEAYGKLEAMKRVNRIRKLKNSFGSSLFESIMMYNTAKTQNIMATEGVDPETVDKMGSVLAESIVTYTTIEMINTIQMYKMNKMSVNEMKKNFLSGMSTLNNCKCSKK